MLRPFYLSQYHPQIPIAVWEFMLTELKLGQKYGVMAMGLKVERLTRQLLQYVRVVCALETNEETRQYLSNQLDTFKNFILLAGTPQKTTLQEDSIDALLLVQPRPDFLEVKTLKEFRRVLRLNSFGILVQHQLISENSPFAQAYIQFLQLYNSLKNDPYSTIFPVADWKPLFDDEDIQYRTFPNQQRLDFEGLKGYYLSSDGAFTEENPQYNLALKALKILFIQYQTDGKITLDYHSHIYYGLLNKYIPAISLRKSLFFNALRPFAFGFYVLVKLNIYFWRFIYAIKERVFGK